MQDLRVIGADLLDINDRSFAESDRRLRDRPEELHGRKGPDPVRYGDWEVKGIASDF